MAADDESDSGIPARLFAWVLADLSNDRRFRRERERRAHAKKEAGEEAEIEADATMSLLSSDLEEWLDGREDAIRRSNEEEEDIPEELRDEIEGFCLGWMLRTVIGEGEGKGYGKGKGTGLSEIQCGGFGTSRCGLDLTKTQTHLKTLKSTRSDLSKTRLKTLKR